MNDAALTQATGPLPSLPQHSLLFELEAGQESGEGRRSEEEQACLTQFWQAWRGEERPGVNEGRTLGRRHWEKWREKLGKVKRRSRRADGDDSWWSDLRRLDSGNPLSNIRAGFFVHSCRTNYPLHTLCRKTLDWNSSWKTNWLIKANRSASEERFHWPLIGPASHLNCSFSSQFTEHGRILSAMIMFNEHIRTFCWCLNALNVNVSNIFLALWSFLIKKGSTRKKKQFFKNVCLGYFEVFGLNRGDRVLIRSIFIQFPDTQRCSRHRNSCVHFFYVIIILSRGSGGALHKSRTAPTLNE